MGYKKGNIKGEQMKNLIIDIKIGLSGRSLLINADI